MASTLMGPTERARGDATFRRLHDALHLARQVDRPQQLPGPEHSDPGIAVTTRTSLRRAPITRMTPWQSQAPPPTFEATPDLLRWTTRVLRVSARRAA